MSKIKLKYYNIQSRILIKEDVIFKNFTFEPELNPPIKSVLNKPVKHPLSILSRQSSQDD